MRRQFWGYFLFLPKIDISIKAVLWGSFVENIEYSIACMQNGRKQQWDKSTHPDPEGRLYEDRHKSIIRMH